MPNNVSLKHVLLQRPCVQAHIGQLERIMDNLCKNALKAMPNGGELTLSTWKSEKQGGVSVSDTGSGIMPEHLERIFEPFFTTRDVGEGTGLGLAVVDSIMQGHGGCVQVKSLPSVGTTFTLTFPLTATVEQ
ncbi:hypothetical protein LG300_13340 [Vreelandella aquamarina]